MKVCSIGFFDGVHRGHQHLIRQVRDEAQRRGARSLLITFDRHPRTIFAPDSVPPQLTTTAEKMALLRATGVDEIFVLPFDNTMAALTAREFMEQVLCNQLGATALVIGYDHHFGRPLSRAEGFEDYRVYGNELGIDVVAADELAGEHVSSSAIRHALEQANVELATRLLGRPYTWSGRVVHGHAVGRQLGFPTANLEATDKQKLLPRNGVYAIMAGEMKGMLNIGQRPTIDNGHDISIETHLFDFQGNLYNQTLELSFIAHLRTEQRFASEDALSRQLHQDMEQAKMILNLG